MSEEFNDDHLYPPNTLTVYRCFKSQCEGFTKLGSAENVKSFLLKAQDIAVKNYEQTYGTCCELCIEKGQEVPAFPDEIKVEKLIDAALCEAYKEYKTA